MSSEQASFYFIYNTLYCLLSYPYALLHVLLFFWVYALQIILWALGSVGFASGTQR